MVKDQIDKVEIEYVKSNDDRSYHINSKIERALNFKPQKNIFQSISDLIYAFDKKTFTNTVMMIIIILKNAKNKFNIMKVRYSYLQQQFSNCPVFGKIKKFVKTGDFTLEAITNF